MNKKFYILIRCFYYRLGSGPVRSGAAASPPAGSVGVNGGGQLSRGRAASAEGGGYRPRRLRGRGVAVGRRRA